LVEVALVVVVTCNSSCNGSGTVDTAITTITRKYNGLFVYGFEYKSLIYTLTEFFNPLKPELNPICFLLALLGVHHFLHVSRIRVKLLTFY